MVHPLPVGSAAWTGGEEYGGEYSERIHQFIDKVNQKALLSYASALRENRPCTISREFSVGSFNLVRKIQFDDGVEWIARLRMPPMPDQGRRAVPPAVEGILLDMESELATMEFVRQNTDISIPKVYGYDLNDQNPVGCPFSILEYIHGNTTEEVSRTYPGKHEGIPAPFEEKLWRQVAKIMVQLASIRLSKIGSIIRNEADPESFVPPPAARADGDAADFGLANYDLNPNNLLVDQEFNILAVIDWDSVAAVPDAALYRFPFLMGISCAIPGVVDTHPAVMKRQQLGRRFAEVVEAVAREQSGVDCEDANKRHTFLLTKAGFFSKESMAFRSLIYVKMRQDWVNYKNGGQASLTKRLNPLATPWPTPWPTP
ncbi:hypothetical protein B0T16DRAFT_319992 [Cercophora newfieldiana]|uniref:Aminoglycoside phosphotransferase domain-containing protein n=1 Tax=Cercophora newfieldiana TaxID=92897 RepID=A0AA40CXT0_9PEZI|nr:hypothetical protein B0T16DRAFT_319992 [Cercophora newfieldiana]